MIIKNTVKIIFILFLGISIRSWAQFSMVEGQPLWEMKLGNTGSDELYKIIENKYGQLVTVGYTESLVNRGTDIMLRIIDGDSLTLVRNIGGSKDDKAFDITETRTEGYILVGSTKSLWPKSVSGEDAWIIKVSNHGIPQWDHIIGSRGDDRLTKIIKGHGDQYLSTGIRSGKPVAVIFNEEGDIIAQKVFQLNDQVFHTIVKATDGTYLILSNKGEGPRANSILYRIDSNLNIIKTNRLERSKLQEGIALIPYGQGEWILAGNHYSKRKGADIVLYKLKSDEKLEPFIPFEIGDRWRENVLDIKLIGNDTLCIVGMTQSHSNNARRTNAFFGMIPISTPRQGQFFHYGGNHTDRFNSSVLTSSGKLLVSGITTAEERSDQDAWILELENFYLDGKKDVQLNLVDYIVSSDSEEIYPGSEGKIDLTLLNPSSFPLNNIVLQINSLREGVMITDKLRLDHVANERETRISVPFKVNDSAQIAPVQIQVIQEEQLVGNIEFNISEPPRPNIMISSIDYELHENVVNTNALVVNTGNRDMSTLKLSIFLPPNVSDVQEISIDLPPLTISDSTQIEYSFPLISHYFTDSLVVRYNLSSTTMEFNKNDYLVYNIIREAEKIEALGIQTIIGTEREIALPDDHLIVETKEDSPIPEQFFSWQYPALEELNPVIEHREYFINLKLQVVSNISLQPDQIGLYINDHPAEADVVYNEQDEEFYFKYELEGRLYYTYKNKIYLKTGENEIEIRIDNEQESHAFTSFVVDYIPPKFDLHFYSIGVDYSETNNPLLFTGKDATDLSHLFSEQGGKLFDEVQDHALTSIEETRTVALKKLFRDMAYKYSQGEIIDKDMIVLYLSAHGYEDPEDRTRLRIAGSDFDELYSDLFSLDYEKDVKAYLDLIPCKKIILLDACHSGSIISSHFDKKGSKSVILSSDIALSKAIERLANMTSQTIIITSSSPGELSYEDESWENSAFAKAIMEALHNQPFEKDGEMVHPDENEDSVIYVSELYNFLRKRVPEIVWSVKDKDKVSQIPYMRVDELKEDIPLFYIQE